MTKASSDRGLPGASVWTAARIVRASQIDQAQAACLGALEPGATSARALGVHDLDNEVGRAAFQMGRRRGLSEGWSRGQAQGHAQGRLEVQQAQEAAIVSALDRLDAVARAFEDELRSLAPDLADQVAVMALSIARQVLRRELAQPETVQAVAREAMQAFTAETGRLRLRLHPSQVQ